MTSCNLIEILVFVYCLTLTQGNYQHVVLDPDQRFYLHWTFDSHTRKIVFRVEVQTKGYLALGFSPNGGMAGSDIVVGYVKDGKAFLQDRHAFKNAMPLLDDQQDWELLGGYENDTYTIMRFQRVLDTCDDQDLPISNNTARVIYAYHEDDPESEDFFPYHGRTNRGTKSIMLLQPQIRADTVSEGTEYWDIRLPNVTIPDDVDTTYWCKIVKAPTLNKKHHVIKVAPLIAKESSPFVHHMVLYRCLGGSARELEPHVHHTGHPCYVHNMPETYTKCESVYASWGIGANAMALPAQAGLPLGDKGNMYFMLQLHYDNGDFRSGVIDQSGFRIYYSPDLRTYDAMTLMVGAAVDPCIVVPPGQKQFVVAGHADPQCLDPVLPPDGIKLFAVLLHSHLLGRQMILRHFRGNIELPSIVADKNYDFNYQEYRYLPEEVAVKPGDQLTLECTYDSSGRNRTTFGGIGTGEEMCLAFVLYYPRIARARAVSSPTCDLVKSLAGMEIREPATPDEDSNYTFYQFFHHYNPWDQTYVEIAQKAMRFGFHNSQCMFGNGTRLQMPKLVTYPRNMRPYTEVDYCASGIVAKQQLSEESIESYADSFTSKYIGVFVFCACFFNIYQLINSPVTE